MPPECNWPDNVFQVSVNTGCEIANKAGLPQF